MMNLVELIGRLVRDPEEQGEGEKIRARYTIAVNRIGSDEADFINCTSFGKQAENILKYCKKGTLISVEGSINTFSYENTEGQRVSGMNINGRRVNFLSKPNSSSNNSGESFELTAEQQDFNKAFSDFGESIEIEDSELPF